MFDSVIKKVLVEEGTLKHDFSRKIIDQFSDASIQQITEMDPGHDFDSTGMGKDTLHLISYKGEFLKPCPGTRKYICCGYQILNLSTNCPIDCSYCILQSYFNQPNLRVFANLEEHIGNVLKTIDSNPNKVFRIGTGEFTDSLAIDHITHFVDLLVPEFTKRKNAVLEFKTKTDRIKGLITSKHRDRIIVSWSLNSPYLSAREEHRAQSLKKRLEAAKICQSEGFTVGFHFDPLVCHENWRDEYLKTIELMDKYIDPNGIIWISMGAFRFMPDLKPVIRKRHPDTCILNGEFIIGLDGKMRYFKPIRIDLFSFMREALEKWHPDTGLYLCMESDDVWQSSIGWSPQTSEGLSQFLDERVEMIFG